MFRYRNTILILVFLVCAACANVGQPPVVTPPPPVPAGVSGWRITLFDAEGVHPIGTYDIGRNDLIQEDVLHRKIIFRVNGRQQIFTGTWRKEQIR